jgi:hypothetical protein
MRRPSDGTSEAAIQAPFTNVYSCLTSVAPYRPLDQHNFPEVVASSPYGGHNFREVVPIKAADQVVK